MKQDEEEKLIEHDLQSNDESRTLQLWKEKTIRLAFIYDFVLDKYRRRVNLFTLISFLLSSITSLTALSNLGLNESDYPTAVFVLKIISAVLTTCAATSAGVPRLLGWPSLVDNYQKYLDSVEHFTASIVSEQVLPVEFRKDPKQFIIQHRDQFLAILNNAPDISYKDSQIATENYEISSPRFRQDLTNI